MDLTCDNCRGPCTCGRLLRDAMAKSLRMRHGGVQRPTRPATPNEDIIVPPSTGMGEGTKH